MDTGVRYINIVFGMLKMSLIALFSFGKITFRVPVRLDKNVVLSRRRGGRIHFGKHVSLNRNAQISVTQHALIETGDYTSIGDNNVIVAREKIVLGSHVMLGANVCIYDHDHVFKMPGIMRDLGYNTSPVIIEDNVWLGAGVIVLRGVRIGQGSVVAAGTVVNKDIPQNSLVYNRRNMVIKPRVKDDDTCNENEDRDKQ